MKMIRPLFLNVGRRSISQYFKTSGLSTLQIAYNLVFMIARLQQCGNFGKLDGLPCDYLEFLNEWLKEYK